MRTLKALACAAALAAGLATSVAQSNVYSLNVVGYYNLPLVANQYYAIANQLNTTNNSIKVLFPAPPLNCNFLKWSPADFKWTTYNFDTFDTVWYPDGDVTLAPGEAALFQSPEATTLTFVGEVEQGTLTTTLLPGQYVARSSIVPQAGSLTTLQYPQNLNDNVLKWDGPNYKWVTYNFDTFDTVWYPEEPTFGVGEGMLINKDSAGTSTAWTRNFTVQ